MDRGDAVSRYARQMQLPGVGATGQARLGAAQVLVIGAGGLAASALPLLVGAGVKRVTILDPDCVEVSNLHRQTLFGQADAGRGKAEVAAARLRGLNSAVEVSAVAQALTPGNAAGLVAQADVVLDCADSYAVSYTLSDVCRAADVGLITASVLGVGGYVAGVCATAPSLRAVFPDAPESGATCASSGVMGPVVAMLGAWQAQMALACVLGTQPSPLGQMVQIDAAGYRSSGFRFDEAPEPARALRFVAADMLGAQDTIVDLRAPSDVARPIHPLARHIDARDLTDTLGPGSGRLALCCATGLRAWRAGETLYPQWRGEIVLVAASAS